MFVGDVGLVGAVTGGVASAGGFGITKISLQVITMTGFRVLFALASLLSGLLDSI